MAGFPKTIRLVGQFVTPPSDPRPDEAESHDPGRTTHAGFNVRTGLGCFRFARRYSGNRVCFLFQGVLRCFTSPRLLPQAYVFSPGMTGY